MVVQATTKDEVGLHTPAQDCTTRSFQEFDRTLSSTAWIPHLPHLQPVEWYHPWANLAPTLTQYMDEQDDVLVCGCGNSELSVDMYDDGEGVRQR